MFKSLVIVALLIGGAQNNVPRNRNKQQNQPQTQPTETHPPTPSTAASEVAQENVANGERYAYYKAHHKEYLKAAIAPAYASNWVLAGLGCIGGILAYLTLLSIKTQSKLLVDKERARIAVEIMPNTLDLEDGPEWTEKMEVVYAGAAITVVNLGGTNALNVVGTARIIGTPDRGSLGPPDVSTLILPSAIKPNTDPISADVITLLKGVDHVSTVRDGAEILHLTGVITYDDIFGKSYKTRFRYLWNVERREIEDKVFDTSRWNKAPKGNKAT